MASISDHVLACQQAFHALSAAQEATAIENPDMLPDFCPLPVEDLLRRFEKWAGNMGAHKKGRSSLDYRLRDASRLRTQVCRLLDDLSESLKDAMSICRGEMIPWDQEPRDIEGNDDEDNDDPAPGPNTELSQISTEINSIIDCLYRISTSIRNPAPHDRFLNATRTNTSHHEPFDIAHTREMFPLATMDLTERLGRALSRRRQYFLYREMHHKKLSQGMREGGNDTVEDPGASTVASSIPGHMKESKGDLSTEVMVLHEDQISESGWTDTTRGSSLADGTRRKIPPPPADAHERPFECPFCYMVVSAPTTAAWTKHVVADLHPYICLAPHCPTPHDQFSGRRQWMRHAVQCHWTFWVCAAPSCAQSFESPDQIRQHVQEQHEDALKHVKLETLIATSERRAAPDTASDCPLCRERLMSIKEFARHVGRHQKHLALFALPRLDRDNEEEQEDGGEDGNTDSESRSDGSADAHLTGAEVTHDAPSDVMVPSIEPMSAQHRKWTPLPEQEPERSETLMALLEELSIIDLRKMNKQQVLELSAAYVQKLEAEKTILAQKRQDLVQDLDSLVQSMRNLDRKHGIAQNDEDLQRDSIRSSTVPHAPGAGKDVLPATSEPRLSHPLTQPAQHTQNPPSQVPPPADEADPSTNGPAATPGPAPGPV